MSAGEILENQLTKMARGVEEFQQKVIDLPVASPPASLPADRKAFRMKFLDEELMEFNNATKLSDEIDALVDLIYVAIGALLEMGIDPEQAFRPVQEANMAKLRGETKRGNQFDAVKPDGWQPPNHDAVIQRMHMLSKMHPAFLECQELMNRRSAAYNKRGVKRGDHFPLGHISFFDIVWLKVMRLRSDVEEGIATGKFNVDRDHPRDLINYCAFWLNFIDGREV